MREGLNADIQEQLNALGSLLFNIFNFFKKKNGELASCKANNICVASVNFLDKDDE